MNVWRFGDRWLGFECKFGEIGSYRKGCGCCGWICGCGCDLGWLRKVEDEVVEERIGLGKFGQSNTRFSICECFFFRSRV